MIDYDKATETEQSIQNMCKEGEQISWCTCNICSEIDCQSGCSFYMKYINGQTSTARKANFMRAKKAFSEKALLEVLLLKKKVPLAIAEKYRITEYKKKNSTYYKERKL